MIQEVDYKLECAFPGHRIVYEDLVFVKGGGKFAPETLRSVDE